MWNLFQTGVQTATSVVVDNSGIVKKVAFPREILALAAVGTSLVFFFFQAIVMVLLMVVLQRVPDWGYIWLLVPALAAVVVMASAFGVFLSAVNVFMRDTKHLIEVVLTAWFWSIPIVYQYQKIAGSTFITGNALRKVQFHGRVVTRMVHVHPAHTWLLHLYMLNPVTPVALTFQRVLYAKISPLANGAPLPLLPTGSWWWYLQLDLIVLVVGAVLLIGALTVFGRLEGNFAEEL